MQPDASGKFPYTGSFDCALQTLKSGGPLKFYTGFPVYCVRIAPHVMVSPHPLDHPQAFTVQLCPPPQLLPSSVQMTWIFLNQIQKVEKQLGL